MNTDSKSGGRRTPTPRGIYEVLVTEALDERLQALEAGLEGRRDSLRMADAADRLGLHLGRVLQRVVAGLSDEDRVSKGIALARALLAVIESLVPDYGATQDSPVEPGAVLRAVTALLPDGTAEIIPEPLIPLLDTTLLTNSPGEPTVGSQLRTEIQSADRIDIIMAFIRRSGIAPLLAALAHNREAGRPLRILTTVYTGSTEASALDELRRIGADVRVSYDTGTTRLHAKAWLFHRRSGFSTAYIGSSNLTHSAQVSGLEWNVRLSGARNPDVVEKMAAVFESYWNNGDFVPYDREEFLARTEETDGSSQSVTLSPLELRLEPFQERLLEQIQLSRALGHHRNLLVSATGTGKTVMAAVDYASLREALPRARLLFVAHREEILEQSRAMFRHCLREQAFGELWVGGQRPRVFDHVFASIQSLNAASLSALAPTHFDVVIVDEFHHAAAKSYTTLLNHLQPAELLGLTATPERSDGLPVLQWFDNRIAAELRLWDAIDQLRLCPFVYYGIHDGMDLREVPWRRGRGYDVDGLTGVLTANDVWAKLVIAQLSRRVNDVTQMRALGFCVSVEHARHMARVFREAGIASTSIWADSPAAERRRALADLASRRVNVVFSVDLFNEGVDVPVVDTLLLLRPTESPTLFLQQLGRGLRRSRGKAVCTVLDFVGHHRAEFRFDRRFQALLGGTRKTVATQVEEGFPFLPAGCHMEFDKVATEIVLRSIRAAIPSNWSAKVEELRTLANNALPVTLAQYLDETGLDVDDVYQGGRCWSDLLEDAGLPVLPPGPNEDSLRRACGRLLHIDDMLRIETYRRFLALDAVPSLATLNQQETRLIRMLVASLLDKALTKTSTLDEGCQLLWAHPQVCAELGELLGLLGARVDHVSQSVPERAELPLRVHAHYSRIEILAGFGIGEHAKVAPWQTGVYWAKEASADLLAFTLDKTSGQFSPTTRYRDYAISRDLVHWESQSATREDSETGQRYQRHVEIGTSVMLFARLRADERAFWFLGPARYLSHESETPMAITWQLQYPLPGDVFVAFAAAVA